MGGNAFNNVRRATPSDKVALTKFLIDIGYEDSFKFIGSSGIERASYGDLDIALHCDGYNMENTWTDLLSIRDNKILETRRIGDALFMNFNGVQVDFNWVKDKNLLESWVPYATQTSRFDPFKALYRNEILYVIMKYLHRSDIELMWGGEPEVFSRYRYTLFEGIVKSTYTYRSQTTGKMLALPRKVKDFTLSTSWHGLKETIFGGAFQASDKELDFSSLLKYIDTKMGSGLKFQVIDEIIHNLNKKEVAIPDILTELHTQYRGDAIASGYYFRPNEPSDGGTLADDEVGEEVRG